MPSAGEKVKQYEILEPIGKGGMGEVFLARDTVLDRKVAIKFLPEEMQKDPKARVRFIREAKSAAALDHPFICKIYETGEIEGKAYIIMEYVEGKTLREKLEEEVLPVKYSLNITLEISDALEKAHEKGIVHRDLKPSNIMCTAQGHIKVMDFGLAKQVYTEEDTKTKTLRQETITERGSIVGTLAYMSPEQARGDAVDARSDIFSLGVILNEMLTGQNYFSHPSAVETLSAILRDSPPPTQLRPKNVNPLLNPILRKAIAKSPEQRYQTVVEMSVDIQKVLSEIAAGSRFFFRSLPVIAASLFFIAILLVGIWWFALRGKISIGPPAPSSQETISVLIADFQNQTGDPIFDGTLEQTLGIGLERAPFVSIYNRAQAREHVKESDPASDGRLTSKNTQLFSRREGINLVLSGWIASSADGYAITAWAMDPVKSERIAEADVTIKSKADALNAVQSLANKLIPQMGDIPPESLKTLSRETFTALSLEAMKLYTEAQDLAALGRDEESIPVYLEAIKKDPNLGRAFAGLAVVYRNRRNKSEANKYYERAMTLLDHMTDREKYRTRGGYYFLNNNYKQAIQEYSALKEQYPADSAGDTNLPLAYFFSRNMPKALEEGQQAVDRHPGRITPWNNLVWYAMAAGKFDKAEQEVRKIIESNPKFPDAYVCLALIEIAKGQNTKASEAYQKLALFGTYEESWASTGLADLALYEGRLNDAKKLLEAGIAKDLEKDDKYSAAYKYTLLAHTLLLQDKIAPAVEAADNAVASSKDEGTLFAAAQVYVQAGEEEKARNVMKELSARVQADPQAYARLIEGEIMLVKGNTAEAVRLFHEAQNSVDTWLGHFALGRAYLQGEEYIEAHSEFDLCFKRYGETVSVFLNDLPSFHYFPPLHYYYGCTQEALNNPGAKESFEKFLKIKEKADEDWMTNDARLRLKNL